MSENGREFAPRGPVEIGNFLGAKAQELDQLSILLQEAHEALEGAEESWLAHYDEVVAQMEEEAEKDDPKRKGARQLPGEDMRVSIARRRGGWEKWTNFRRAERLVKRLEKEATQKANVISAAQSEGNLLRAGAA